MIHRIVCEWMCINVWIIIQIIISTMTMIMIIIMIIILILIKNIKRIIIMINNKRRIGDLGRVQVERSSRWVRNSIFKFDIYLRILSHVSFAHIVSFSASRIQKMQTALFLFALYMCMRERERETEIQSTLGSAIRKFHDLILRLESRLLICDLLLRVANTHDTS